MTSLERRTSYRVSAPGSLMVMGEHAVLYGSKAIVLAIEPRISVELRARADQRINIFSQAFGSFSATIERLQVVPPYSYVLAAISQVKHKLGCGFDLNIESSFSSTMGWGSSAAVTVATLAVLNWWLDGRRGLPAILHAQGMGVLQTVQGFGSGADLAASLKGGVIAYARSPLSIRSIIEDLPLLVLYSGKKVPTHEVLKILAQEQKKYPKLFSGLYAALGETTQRGIHALSCGNLAEFGRLMEIHHGLQEALGCSNPSLSLAVAKLRSNSQVLGAKISGAGLGDCIIAVGSMDAALGTEFHPPQCLLPMRISERGLVYSRPTLTEELII